jgi:hypothetical protein
MSGVQFPERAGFFSLLPHPDYLLSYPNGTGVNEAGK